MAVKQSNSKEIIALNTFEAVRLRPTMYIGQIAPMEDKLPLIVDGKLKMVDKTWSPGFMHLIVEILENALDEAKRCKGKMKNVYVTINQDTNEVTIQDEGNGFYKANSKHSKTKKNVVRTAMEELHAGSNFVDTDTNILGTNGVGAAVTNILSEKFSITTINKTHRVHYDWEDFVVVNEEKTPRNGEKLGTKVSFTPSTELFPRGTMTGPTIYNWDDQLISAYLSFKAFLIQSDPIISNLNLVCNIIKDGKESPIPVTTDFIEGDYIKVETSFGAVYLWESYENSGSVSFANGSQCTGIHQKVVNDWVNNHFKYNLAHHFYETLIVLNLPSSLMRFADQNKTKLGTGRGELEEELEDNFKSKLLRYLKKSDISSKIEQRIEDRLHADNIGKIKKANRQSKRKISEKYSPPSKNRDVLYITEGLSARGSVIQARDSESEGVYALKGKVKNTRKLSDLTNNVEILEIMSILDILPDDTRMPSFNKIVIAADEDPDGHHISSLIINFFQKWFPHIIKDNRLYKIITPLVACNYGKDRHYFYTSEEFQEFARTKKVSNVTYLKGLGSLSMDDWKHVMNNKILFQIYPDRSAKRYLDIAFGVSAQKRKTWLEGKN